MQSIHMQNVDEFCLPLQWKFPEATFKLTA